MAINSKFYEQMLEIIPKDDILLGEDLRNHTYTKLGGKADYYITPSTYKQIQKIIKLCQYHMISYIVIGNGSNLIIRDGGVRGVVFSLIKFNKITVLNTSIIAQSGASIINTSQKALEEELTGLEFACGIPGSVGGVVYMNAGAYGGEIKDVLSSCLVIDKYGNLIRRKVNDLNMGYRYSNIGEKGDIILEATFRLKFGSYEMIKAVMDDLTVKRKSNQPLEYPSCGSVFKRPSGYYAGKLIQDSNLQGIRIGGAEVSKKHAGFIVNINNATAREYISLIEYIQKTVKEKFNVNLEREVKIIGED